MTDIELDDLSYSGEYAEYIMSHGDNSEVCIHNGDSLLIAMENGYLFEEFLDSIGG